MKAAWPIVALAIGAFGIGATEFSPMGLLPVIANGVGVSIPVAGLLVSGYAVGVMVGAPVMTLALRRTPRKTALIALMGIFALGNLLAALSPDYGVLMAARVFTSLAHGAFFGLGTVVAAGLAPAGQSAAAVSGMFMGLALANIGGVPAATWIGQQIGWRAAFVGIAALGVFAMIALAVAVPKCGRREAPDLRSQLRVLLKSDVLLALLTTVAGSGAMFTLYTYVAPLLAQASGATAAFTTFVLVLIGIGFTAGNALGGRLTERWLDGGLMAFLTTTVVTTLVFPISGRTPIGAAATLTIWAVSTFAIVPPLQARVMRAAADAPGLASAVNIGAFNLGNAVGAAIGGAVIALGFGYVTVPLAGAAMAALSLTLALVQARRLSPSK